MLKEPYTYANKLYIYSKEPSVSLFHKHAQRALCIIQRALHLRKRAVYFTKRARKETTVLALCSIHIGPLNICLLNRATNLLKRALCIMKRALFLLKRARKETTVLALCSIDIGPLNICLLNRGEVGGWGRDPKECTGRDWGMGSRTI